MAEQRTPAVELAAVPGCRVHELPPPAGLASVIARRGRIADATAIVALETDKTLFLPSGPGHWLALSESHATEALATIFGDTASVCDQTGSRVRFEVAGARARELLGKGVGIDLHPTRFAVGQVAVTSIAHMGAMLWRLDEKPTFHLLVARSYAESFRHWLRVAAASLGEG